MNMTITKMQGVTIIHLAGDIDGRTAPQIQDALLATMQTDGKLLLEMSRVDYMSSAGLRLLLLLYRQISDSEGQVALVGLPEMIQDTMSITGFLDFFTTYNTLEEGVAAMNNNV